MSQLTLGHFDFVGSRVIMPGIQPKELPVFIITPGTRLVDETPQEWLFHIQLQGGIRLYSEGRAQQERKRTMYGTKK